MTTISRVSLIRKLAHRLFSGSGRLPSVLGTTTALGSTTTAQDLTRLAYDASDANYLDGVYFRVDELVAGGPASGEFARINTAGLAPTTGIVTLRPALTLPVQSGTDYSLHLLPPSLLEEAINWALNQMRYETYGPLSLLVDADMEAAGAGDWPGTGATVTKYTGADGVWAGKQGLSVVNTGANGFASSSLSVLVNAGETMMLSAIARAPAGGALGDKTAKLIVEGRETVSYSEIDSVQSIERRFTELRLDFTVPTAMKELRAKLQGLEADATIYWDDVVLLGQSREILLVPSWVEDEEHILEVVWVPRGSGAPLADTFRIEEHMTERWSYFKPLQDRTGANPLRIQLQPAPTERVYVRALRRHALLTTDAGTTTANEDEVLAGARVYLRQVLFEGAILDANPGVLAALKAAEAQDSRLWSKTAEEPGGKTRMVGLRKFSKG